MRRPVRGWREGPVFREQTGLGWGLALLSPSSVTLGDPTAPQLISVSSPV